MIQRNVLYLGHSGLLPPHDATLTLYNKPAPRTSRSPPALILRLSSEEPCSRSTTMSMQRTDKEDYVLIGIGEMVDWANGQRERIQLSLRLLGARAPGLSPANRGVEPMGGA